jgi:hypothetical protein
MQKRESFIKYTLTVNDVCFDFLMLLTSFSFAARSFHRVDANCMVAVQIRHHGVNEAK